MYINITDSETGNNKGSSGQLVHYLEKENRMDIKEEKEKELWFNNHASGIQPQEVRVKIDNNVAKLSNDDAKFFLINISPSQKEMIHLKENFGDQGAEEQLKKYAVNVMDAYARNFKRSGIEDSKDLLWFGKLERYRYYTHNDPEVKEGVVKAGEHKPGDQTHIQIIVSRKDISNKIKLSPMNNSRGRNQEHSARLGQFDRVAFKESAELLFNQIFSFDRPLKDSIHYAITMKNGNVEQKRAIHLFEQFESKTGSTDQQNIPSRSKYIFRNNDTQLEQLITNSGGSVMNLVNTLLSPDPMGQENIENQYLYDQNKKKKRKRRPPGI